MAYQRSGYYYRSVRVGRQVRTEYLGSGNPGAAMAARYGAEAARRQEALRHRRQILEEVQAQNRESDLLACLGRALTAAVLVANGYHRHKGTWRRCRA